MPRQLLAHLGRQARQRGIVEISRNADRLIALQLRDVLVLAPQIGGVAGVDLELGRDSRLEPADLRPDRPSAGRAKHPGSASRSNAVRRRPSRLTSRPCRAASVGVSESWFSNSRPSRERLSLGFELRLPGSSDATGCDAGWGQPLVGVVGAELQAELGARREHAIGLGNPARNEVVDHHAEVPLGPRNDERICRAAGRASAALIPASRPWAPASSYPVVPLIWPARKSPGSRFTSRPGVSSRGST